MNNRTTQSRMHIRGGFPGLLRASRPNRRVRDVSQFNPKPGTTAAKVLEAARNVFSVVDCVAARRDNAVQSGSFTPRGTDDETRKFALTSGVPVFKRGRDLIASARRELEQKRAAIKLKPIDTADPWQVVLMTRTLDDFRALPQKKKDELTRNRETLDPLLARTLRYAPRSVSGMSEVHYRELIKDALNREHSTIIAEVEELEAIIEAATDVIETGREEVRLEAGVCDRRAWDEIAAPYEKKANAPWLKKFKENGVEVVRKIEIVEGANSGTAPLASPDEIELGIFADNVDAYKKLTGRGA